MRPAKLKRKIARRKAVIIIIPSIILFVFMGACTYMYSILSSIKHTDISKPPETVSEEANTADPQPQEATEEIEEFVPLKEPEQKEGGVVNIALFGLDRRENEPCRTDTIMILSINKDNRKIKLTSLMRDMYVKIPGRKKNRINAAYAYGGPGLAINTINENFDMDIRYYASVDFKGIKSLIDKLGGTDIDLKEGEIPHINSNSEKQIENPGMNHLDGEQTLAYMRIRYYGNGDYERTERQRRVLTQLYEKVKKTGILKLPELLSTILPHVETNMSNNEIIGLSIQSLSFGSDIEQYRLPVDGSFSSQRIDGKAVLVPDLEKNTEYLHNFIYGEKVVGDVSD